MRGKFRNSENAEKDGYMKCSLFQSRGFILFPSCAATKSLYPTGLFGKSLDFLAS